MIRLASWVEMLRIAFGSHGGPGGGGAGVDLGLTLKGKFIAEASQTVDLSPLPAPLRGMIVTYEHRCLWAHALSCRICLMVAPFLRASRHRCGGPSE